MGNTQQAEKRGVSKEASLRAESQRSKNEDPWSMGSQWCQGNGKAEVGGLHGDAGTQDFDSGAADTRLGGISVTDDIRLKKEHPIAPR